MMTRLCLFLFAFAAIGSAQTVTVSASHIVDSSNNPVTGKITFTPASPFRVTGSGQIIKTGVTAVVTTGAFSITLADTSTAQPANPCYVVIVHDQHSNSVMSTGYECVQMSTAWCANGICNFDLYLPGGTPLPVNSAAATAIAAAVTPTLCPTGQAPTGVDAHFDAVGCAVSSGGTTPSAGTVGQVQVAGPSGAFGAVDAKLSSFANDPGYQTSPQVQAAITALNLGTASTHSASDFDAAGSASSAQTAAIAATNSLIAALNLASGSQKVAVTTVGSPGLDTNVPTEKATRTAIAAAQAAAIAASDPSGSATSAQTAAQAFAANASNSSSGTLPAARLPATAVTPGSYTNPNVTIDGTGRVTSATNGTVGTTSHTISGYFNGSGVALTAGTKVYLVATASCTITNWTLLVDTGIAVVDIWKITSTTALPTVANTITASATPAIASGVKSTSSTLTGWTTAVTAGDTIAIDLKTVSGPTVLTFGATCQ